MKNIKKCLIVFILVVSVLFLQLSCKHGPKYPETYVTIATFPENVKSVHIEGVGNMSPIYENAVNNVMVSNIKGKCKLLVQYSDISETDRKTYAGFGNLSSDSAPLKVFLNGTELENQTEYKETSTRDILTNAKIERFEAEFEAGDTVSITFENSPRKIPNSDLRLLNETGYCYYDITGIGAHINASIQDQSNGAGGLSNITYDGLYFSKIDAVNLYLEYDVEKNYKITSDTFKRNGTAIEPVGDYIYIDPSSTSGDVVRITGGVAELIDSSNFAGKTFTASGNNIIKTSAEGETINSITLVLSSAEGERTYTLTVDSKTYTGIWYMRRDNVCIIGISYSLNGNQHGVDCSMYKNTDDYTFNYSTPSDDTTTGPGPSYTVTFTAQ